MSHILLFSGTSNEPLATGIASQLGIPLANREIIRFADGEIRPWVQENVRDRMVFVIQSFSQPMNDNIMEMVLLSDAIKRGAPRRMICVVPYFGYARQDKQHRPGEPVSARVVAKLLEVVPFQEVVTIDLHNDAIVGFFRIPVVHLSALPILGEHIKSLHLKDIVIVSPDVGGVKRARNLAYLLDVPIIVMEKKRDLDKKDTSEIYQIIGEVKGKTAILIDDIISTGGTIVNGATALKDAGAKSVYVAASHGVFANDAIKKLEAAPIENVLISDSIRQTKELPPNRFSVVSVSSLLADAIRTISGV